MSLHAASYPPAEAARLSFFGVLLLVFPVPWKVEFREMRSRGSGRIEACGKSVIPAYVSVARSAPIWTVRRGIPKRNHLKTCRLFRVTGIPFFCQAAFSSWLGRISTSTDIPRRSWSCRIILSDRPRLRLSISDVRFRVPKIGSRFLRVNPCCSIRNLTASIGSGGSIG